jgi:predicted enzyme related to lactoylglutathione lyase
LPTGWVIVGEAAAVRLEGELDVVAWSQFFFPSDSRAGALATTHAALRAGGVIVAAMQSPHRRPEPASRSSPRPVLDGLCDSCPPPAGPVGRLTVLGRSTVDPTRGVPMLNRASVTANIPAADIDRARSFYADTLGMTPSSEMPDAGMLIYRTDGGTTFQVYQTEFAGQAGHTIAQFHVDDVEGEARALQKKGVALETYDMPGVTWDDGVADMGGMGKAAWFKDSEGNILCIDSGFPAG